MAQLLLCLLPVDLPHDKKKKKKTLLSIPNSFYSRSFFFPLPLSPSLLFVRGPCAPPLAVFSSSRGGESVVSSLNRKTWDIQCSDGPPKSPQLVCPLFLSFFDFCLAQLLAQADVSCISGWSWLSCLTVLELCWLNRARADAEGDL